MPRRGVRQTPAGGGRIVPRWSLRSLWSLWPLQVRGVAMRILVGFEESQRVTIALRQRGHEAYSCDILPCSGGHPEWHIQGSVWDHLRTSPDGAPWDAGLFFPPCTYLCSSGLHWNKRRPGRQRLTDSALDDVRRLMALPFPWAIENPVGCISTQIRKPDQIIQPWQFGHPESKTTCLWLNGLAPLRPTEILDRPPGGRWENQTASGQNRLGPSEDRARIRSKTYEGIATAMAEQWF